MATFLERYQAGDRAAVWDDLVALGEGVRHELYYADAAAVAAQTMRRARHNVELLIQRLDAMGYRFLTTEVNEKNHGEALGRLYKIHKQVASKVSRPLDWMAFLGSEEGRRAVEDAAEHNRTMAIEFMKKALAGQPAPLENRDVLDRPTNQTDKDLGKLEKMAGGPLPLSLRAACRCWVGTAPCIPMPMSPLVCREPAPTR